MGKLLFDDVFFVSSPTTTFFNEPGVRSASDASNPAQFKNLATGWADASMIFSNPQPFSAPYPQAVWQGGILSNYVATITDDAEKMLRTIFSLRYHQIYRRINAGAACNSACNQGPLSRCAREILVEEFISIAKEFVTEAKTLFPGAPKFSPNSNFVAPVELGAAKIFDLHYHAAVPLAGTTCSFSSISGDELATSNTGKCINASLSVPLMTQRDLDAMPVQDLDKIVNDVQALGIGSLNAYLPKLGQASYLPPSDNLLLDLHGSTAEYAFNFGIFDTLLSQDSRQNTASATCNANFPFTGTQATSFATTLGIFLPAASTRTLCSLLKEMSDSLYGTRRLSGVTVYNNMFRVGLGTGTC